jgi:hypothetical protein
MAAGVAALTLVGSFSAKPLLAQIKAVFIQNVDEPGRIPYQSYAVFAQGSPGCSGPGCFSCSGTFCALSFTPVPNNKRLVVTSVFGKVYVNPPGVLAPIQLLVTGSGSSVFIPTVLQQGTFSDPLTNSTANIIGVNATGTLVTVIDGGAIPKVNLLSTTAISLSNLGSSIGQMMLSGYLVDCSAIGSCASIVN